MAMVTGLVLLFAFTAGGVIWLARDVNRSVSHRAVAQSIAFQAARSGAQQIGVASLRESAGVLVDEGAARRAAELTAVDLLTGYGLEGHIVRVTVIPPDTVEVEVRVSDPAGDVVGVAAARAEAGI
jgi:hypothetical protein